jgi:hypothetical protein
MDSEIEVTFFRGSEPWQDFREYLEIKYRVFIVEQGWPGAQQRFGSAPLEPDRFDGCARFLLARSKSGCPMGVIRGIPVAEGFPHRELFKRHLDNPVFMAMFPKLCSLNALAVLPEFRRGRYVMRGRGWRASLGRLLVLEMLLKMMEEGMRAAVATAQGPVSLRLFSHLGFDVVDCPVQTDLHPSFLMTNVGMIFADTAQPVSGTKLTAMTRAVSPETEALRRYFAECQQNVLANCSQARLP